jgi:hypothetical protein
MTVASARVVAASLFLISRLDLDLEEDIDEDPDDESDDDDFDRDDDDDDDSDLDEDEDEEEPETWQVSCTPKMRQEYSERSTCGCESPKGRLNLTFQPLTA